MASLDNERRRYFRVTDLVGIHYRFLNDSERDLAMAAQPTSLQTVLNQLESEITTVLQSVKASSPDVHHVLELFNQKINLAFGHGIADQSQDAGSSVRACQVNISACGIAFPAPEEARLNQYVELDLTLYPSNLRIQLVAAVIACENYEDELNDNRYLIRADFVNISDSDQELLVQHVIKRQSQLLKEQREKDQDEPV